MSDTPVASSPAPTAKSSGAPPPGASTPAPAAAKKARAKRPAADGATPPPAKKPKKADTPVSPGAAPKKTAPKPKKPKEDDEPEEQMVGEKEQERRLAEIEAEEQEVVEEEADANTWQDSVIRQDVESENLYEAKLTTLYSIMTAEQQERYSKFRSSGISEQEFSEEVLRPLGLHASAETSTVMRAIGKMFIGELLDTALMVLKEWDDVGPLRPVHLHEAYRRIEGRGDLPNTPKTLKFGQLR